ncbi:Clp protease N-terminal domain-containing protein [Actinomadura rugatobispora]|uniref:Clp protease N-terminal domain-containing protein n=1 Tax=Actinomadura rugatobispora TaxID=1994 RepID=A0ABW1AE80_9ACTN|nr:hypothetical protein GCM10010200_037380 [Actinomadura rugatobispora]
MRLEPHTAGTDASREVMEPLVEAFRRAVRLGHSAVGTEHLLFALLKGESAAKELLAPTTRVCGTLMGVIAAKEDEDWVSADGAGDAAATAGDTPDVATLLREAEWLASQRQERRGERAAPENGRPLPTGALAAALAHAFLRARELGASRANETHMLMGLMHDPGNRAGEALLERRMDRDDLIARLAVHPSARQDGTPHTLSLDGLRNMGMLTQRGRLWGGLARTLSSGGFGSPVLPTVRLEARCQAVRLGHSHVTTVHLLLAMLAVDDQLTAAGQRLRAGLAEHSTGAELLRGRGVTLPAAVKAAADLIPVDEDRPDSPDPTDHPAARQAMTRARLHFKEREDGSAGTTHLLTVLLADPDDPCDALLAAVGVDTGELRRTLGH